jgi:hypothetical protein
MLECGHAAQHRAYLHRRNRDSAAIQGTWSITRQAAGIPDLTIETGCRTLFLPRQASETVASPQTAKHMWRPEG